MNPMVNYQNLPQQQPVRQMQPPPPTQQLQSQPQSQQGVHQNSANDEEVYWQKVVSAFLYQRCASFINTFPPPTSWKS